MCNQKDTITIFFYQHVTDIVFKSLVKQRYDLPEPVNDAKTPLTPLTREEENALHMWQDMCAEKYKREWNLPYMHEKKTWFCASWN